MNGKKNGKQLRFVSGNGPQLIILGQLVWYTPGWHKLWQAGKWLARTNRIFEDQEVSQGVISRSDLILRSLVLGPQSLVLSPQRSQPHNYWIVRLA